MSVDSTHRVSITDAGAPADGSAPGRRADRPPVPHEHGAWFILYVPLLIPLLAGSAVPLVPSILLILVVTSAFLGQNAFRLILRQRHKNGPAFWLAVYGAVLLFGLTGLFYVYRFTALFTIGGAAVVLFGVHTLLGGIPRKRFDRSRWGDFLAIAALTLTAPAAAVVAYGTLDVRAWYIWGACILYFSSGVFYVKMLLSAARQKESLDRRRRWTIGYDLGLYHTMLMAVVAANVILIDGWAAWLVALAYTPVVIRAFYGWATLSATLPPLKRIGWKEALYSLWFMIIFSLTMRYLL